MKALSRRKFFGAAAATPIALRQAAGEAAAGSMGYGIPTGGGMPLSPDSTYETAHNKTRNKLAEWIRSGKLTDWQRKYAQRQARQRARFLDADLLNMRSLSDASRYRMQEDREFERVCQEDIDDHERGKGWISVFESVKRSMFGS